MADFAGWISVVVAAVAALFAWKQARSAADSAATQERVAKDQNQPYVFADIRSDVDQPQLIVLSVKNSGPTVARDVQVRFEPPLVSQVGATPIEQWSVTALTPGSELVRPLTSGAIFFNEGSVRGVQKVFISANGPFGPIGILSYEIDIPELGNAATGNRTVHHVAKSLEIIAKKFSN